MSFVEKSIQIPENGYPIRMSLHLATILREAGYIPRSDRKKKFFRIFSTENGLVISFPVEGGDENETEWFDLGKINFPKAASKPKTTTKTPDEDDL